MLAPKSLGHKWESLLFSSLQFCSSCKVFFHFQALHANIQSLNVNIAASIQPKTKVDFDLSLGSLNTT